jgi:acetolactate synthase-1/2/3 large subunit
LCQARRNDLSILQELQTMTAAELFVRCLENEGVEYIFGIPGEENIDIMDALLDSPIKFITTRHEQGRPSWPMSMGDLPAGLAFAWPHSGRARPTSSPGSPTPIWIGADRRHCRPRCDDPSAQGKSPDPAAGEPVSPISKYATQILEPEIVPEIVRKAFKVAQTEKPGGAFIEFPENIAEAKVEGTPSRCKRPTPPLRPTTRSSRRPRSSPRPRLP